MDHSVIDQPAAWIIFNVFVLALLAIDLGVFHRKAHAVSFREAMSWTVVWIVLALAFNAGLYFWRGPQTALEFFTGYLIEKSLSIDNIFVFLMVFAYFKVPDKLQHKVLFWGILGALVMRAIFIFTGVALLNRFDWIIYVFGGFLIVTGFRMAFQKEKEVDPEKNVVIRFFKRFFRVTHDYQGSKFIVKQDGKWVLTPLFLVLMIIETTDLVFALDSIPAILAITPDPFIVYTSNVFAILGLRSLFFAVSGALLRFRYIHYGLATVLIFVGIKMTISEWYHLPTAVSLGVVAFLLGGSMVASIWANRRERIAHH